MEPQRPRGTRRGRGGLSRELDFERFGPAASVETFSPALLLSEEAISVPMILGGRSVNLAAVSNASCPANTIPISMRMPLLAALSLLAPIVVALPSNAAAHGDVPLATDLRAWPGDSNDRWVLETNFGIVTSSQPRRYACEESFSGSGDYQLAALGVDSWVAFTETEILRTEDGCTFQNVRSVPRLVRDSAARPSARQVAFVHNATDVAGVWRSDDRGESFARIDRRSELYYTGVDFLGDGRLVVAGYVTGPNESRGEARFFAIDGSSSSSLRRAGPYKYPKLLAVRGEQIAWLGRKEGSNYMLWGTIDTPVRGTREIASWPSDAVFSKEERRLWVAGVGDRSGGDDSNKRGFLVGRRSDDGSITYEKRLDSHSALCVGRANDTIYVCGRHDRESADLQRVTSEGVEDVLDFRRMKGPRSGCDDSSNVGSACPTVWPDLRDALDKRSGDAEVGDTGTTSDAAVSDASMRPDPDTSSDDAPSDANSTRTNDAVSASDDASSTSGSSSGSSSDGSTGGCHTTDGDRPPTPAFTWMLAVLGVGAWYRRNTRHDT